MTSTINASTTAGIVTTADTSGVLALQTAGTTAVSISASQVVTLTNALAEASGGTGTTVGYNGFKNRIINGAMVIDQRATSLTAGGYSVDRWEYIASASTKATVAQSTTATTGFINSLLATSSSAYSVAAGDFFAFGQKIEGLNISDLAWGTASAATVTLSFWVRSSLTGTFGGALRNSAADRSYPFSYTINSANTFEQKSITIAGDTSGTWLTTNGIGIRLSLGFGVGTTFSGTAGAWGAGNFLSATGATSVVGTNGATFYITGVQLEKGSTATSFDYRPYGTELQLCQRYFESTAFPDVSFGINAVRVTVSSSTNAFAGGFSYLVPKRTNSPTVTLYSRNGTSGKTSLVSTGADVAGTSTANNIGGTGFWGVSIGTPPAAGSGIEAGWTASAEL